MGWRYRKRIKVAPGLYINVGKSGVSTTIGGKGASVNIGRNGTYVNTGIPGTGIYRRDKISGQGRGAAPQGLAGPASGRGNAAGGGYDNRGCYWFILLFVGSLFLVYKVREGIDFVGYLMAFGLAFVAWFIVVAITAKRPDKGATSESAQADNAEAEPAETESAQAGNAATPLAADGHKPGWGLAPYLSWSKESFDMMTHAAVELHDFLTAAVKNQAVSAEVDRMMALTNHDGSPWPLNNKITITQLLDAYRCYRGLGYDLGTGDDEELGLLLFANEVVSRSFKLEYANIPTYRDQVSQSVRQIFDEVILVNNASPIPEGQFFYQHVFENVAQEKMSQYMVLLYRFASTIAKMDGTVNEEESKWLAGLMKSKDVTTGGKPLQQAKKEAKAKDKGEGGGKAVRTQAKDELGAQEQLAQLVGLDSVKEEVTRLSNFIKIMKIREKQGLPVTPMSYHCVFTGNPGTGKTTVARILAQIYSEMGLLTKGHLVETDRSGLVAEYVGQTAVKTNKIIDSALDGVLFIDEAYSLVAGSKEDFGTEAISTLLKRMEDDRDRLVVILAGYGNEMKQFIDTNPGLQSRFNRYIHFPDYNAKDLLEIYKRNLSKHKYELEPGAESCMAALFEYAVAHKDKNFGNARFVRNLFEKTLENQAMRLSSIGKLTDAMLCTITLEDVRPLSEGLGRR